MRENERESENEDEREKERERERETYIYRKRVNTATATLSATLFDKSQRVQSIIKEKSHKFQQRLFIRSCPNFDVVFVFVKLLLHSLVIFFCFGPLL